MIHSIFNIPTTMILLAVCFGVGYGCWKRGETLWTLGAIGFAVFMFWPQWPQAAYRGITDFVSLNPEGRQLLAAIILLVVGIIGFRIMVTGKKPNHRKWL